MIPRTYMLGIAAALVAVLCLSSYVAGRKHVREQMNALRQSYEVAAAQSAAREAERVRMWTQASKVAGEKYDERARMADSNFDTNLDRLRNAFASTKGLRLTPGSAALCPADSIGTKAELLREAETLIGAIRDADKDRAGLIGAMESWPR